MNLSTGPRQKYRGLTRRVGTPDDDDFVTVAELRFLHESRVVVDADTFELSEIRERRLTISGSEPEVAVGPMGIGLDYGGFGVESLPAGDLERILSAFPRLKMKQRFSDTCCRLVAEKPATSYDNFLRDFGERFVPGYKPVSTVDMLMNAPFDE
jgi:hypothetical protein